MRIFPQHLFSPIIVILLLCLFLSLLHPLFAYVLCISSILKISNESAILFDCKKAVCSLTQFQHNTVVAVKNLNTHFCLHSRLVSVTFLRSLKHLCSIKHWTVLRFNAYNIYNNIYCCWHLLKINLFSAVSSITTCIINDEKSCSYKWQIIYSMLFCLQELNCGLNEQESYLQELEDTVKEISKLVSTFFKMTLQSH